MIKSLNDARITDGLPRILAKQPWVKALSEAMGTIHEMTMYFADGSQTYIGLETAPEIILDAMAVNWKIDWYDASYEVEQKRRIVKTALVVRRIMGTVAAIKLQVNAIYPGTTVEEWFQYGGQAGHFRVLANLPKNGISSMEYQRLKNSILTTKNLRSHLDMIDIRYECETSAVIGAYSSMNQTVEIYPEGG